MLYFPKYENSSVIPEDICTKPFSDPIISRSTKCMTGIILYTSSDIEHHQLMTLNEFVIN